MNVHVSKSNHADSLPDTKTNTRSDTPVKTLDAVLAIYVAEGLADSQILWTVRVNSLALHLDTDDLNRLVPGRQATTDGTSSDLFKTVELLTVLLSRDLSDPDFSKTGETKSRTPVCSLSNGDGVDALVDSTDTFTAVDVHESSEGAWGLDACSSHLGLGDFDSLHACAETHGSVGLGNTTSHTTTDSTDEVIGAESFGIVLCFGSHEEKDGTFGRGLDPGPGNETLVVYRMQSVFILVSV